MLLTVYLLCDAGTSIGLLLPLLLLSKIDCYCFDNFLIVYFLFVEYFVIVATAVASVHICAALQMRFPSTF